MLLALAACLELRTQVGTARVPNDATTMAIYDWLATQPDGPVMEFPAAGLIHGPFEPIQQMYGSIHDWKPHVAGYSGFIPQPHYDLIAQFDARDGQPSMPTARTSGCSRTSACVGRHPSLSQLQLADGGGLRRQPAAAAPRDQGGR